MTSIESLRAAGRQTIRLPGVVIVYYVCNLLAALVVIAPAAMAISAFLGHSLESERELATLDPAWIVESLRRVDFVGLKVAPALFAAVALVYFLLNVFLSGGSIAVYLKPADTFFGASARYFLRFFRLTLWSVPAYGLVIALNGGIAKLLSKLAENSMEARPWIMLGWARAVLALLLLWLVNMAVDYAKIIMVAESRRSAVFALLDAVRLLRYNFSAATGIFYTGQVLGILFLLAYHGATELIPQNSMAMLILVLALRQLYMLFRFWMRLLVWSAEANYYASLVEVPDDWQEPLIPHPGRGDGPIMLP